MTDIALQLDPAEQHVVVAALTLYEALLAHGLELGGDAQQTAEAMGPIASRVSRRLAQVMYGIPAEPVWLVSSETVEKLKSCYSDPDLALGDHHVGVGL